MSQELEREVAALRGELARLNGQNVIRIYNRPMRLLGYSFAQGLAFGLGTVLGGGLVLSIVASMLAQIDFVPIIGEWAAEIARQLEEDASNNGQ